MDTQNQLIEAVKAGKIEQVLSLLEQDSSLVNAHSACGSSAIVLATYYGHPEIARLLVERGAELDLFEAEMTGRVERLRELLDESPKRANAVAPDGFGPLGLAAFFGHLPAVELLLARGAQVNTPSQNDQQVMPLHSAAAGRHLEIARLLLAKGADPRARQVGGFTPLHSAAQNGQLELVELLIQSGADPDARSDDGRFPLDLAHESNHSDVVEFLEEISKETRK
jgi:ankyrin repeat protein